MSEQLFSVIGIVKTHQLFFHFFGVKGRHASELLAEKLKNRSHIKTPFGVDNENAVEEHPTANFSRQ